MTGVCARVDVVVDVVDGVLCREKPLARQFSPADLFTASSSDSSSCGALEVVKGVVRSASSSEEAVVGLKRKGRGMVSGRMVGRVSGQLALGRWVSLKEEEELI